MASDFVLFGPVHLAIRAAVPASAAVLARLVRGRERLARQAGRALGCALLINELTWYVYKVRVEGVRFPEGLPLQFCDFALWSTILALLTLKPSIYEIAYFAGLAGSSMAVITPDLWAPALSYPTFYFFLAHAGLASSVLYMTWSGLLRPRPGSLWRALIAANLFAAVAGAFNTIFHTNYMFLCRKPASFSLLDYLGPWPVYLFAGEALALVLFLLLGLPFRRRREGAGGS